MNASHHTLAIKFLSARKCKAFIAHIRAGPLADTIDGYTANYLWLRFPSKMMREAMMQQLKATVPKYSIIIKNKLEVLQIN